MPPSDSRPTQCNFSNHPSTAAKAVLRMLAGVWYSMLLADALLRIYACFRNRISIPTGPSRLCQTLHAASDLRADAGYPDLFAQRSIATFVDSTLDSTRHRRLTWTTQNHPIQPCIAANIGRRTSTCRGGDPIIVAHHVYSHHKADTFRRRTSQDFMKAK